MSNKHAVTQNSKPATPELPPDVVVDDLKYPEYSKGLTGAQLKELGLSYEQGWVGSFTFYNVAGRNGFGWCLMTLDIAKGKRGHADRSYGVVIKDGTVCRCGNGPHVTAQVTVYLNADNVERLARYVELWKKGMADAGSIRDRISTRRARGQQMRAEGRTHWSW